MTSVPDLYSYSPIKENETRLCRFLDDNLTDGISAELKIFSINALPQYQTVSYVWSPDGLAPTRNWYLKISGAQLPILDNLRPFIRTLRANGLLRDGSWWWIDSLCIDLANTKERSLQVQLMRHLYSNCQKCIVWLGEESDNSERAVDFIQLLHRLNEGNHNINDMRMTLQQEEYQLSWNLLEEFFMRKWWTRVWTLQEFVLPLEISFWCGSRTLSRSVVYASLLLADKCDSTRFDNSIAFRGGWNRIRVWRLHKELSKTPGLHARLSIPALAAYCCTNEATNDIDRLYGLHGLSGTDRELLEIDYSQSVDQIYFRFTKSFIEKHKSLDLTIFASIFPSSAGSSLPSWVPDWRRTPASGLLVVPLMVSQSSNTNLGNLRPPAALDCTTPPFCYSAAGNAPAIYVFQGSTLCVRGIAFDYLDRCETSIGDQEPESENTLELPTAHSTRSSEDILISLCRSLVLNRHDRYLRFPMPTEEFFKEFIGLCALSISDPTAVESKFLEWFNQMLHFQIHGLSIETLVLRHLKEIEIDSPSSAPNQDHSIQDSFLGRFYDCIVRMSLHLTVTRNGRVGMVCEKARQGDLICILYGCSVPVILRKVGDGDAYILVGECFIDKCMSGEELDSDHQETTFRIQ